MDVFAIAAEVDIICLIIYLMILFTYKASQQNRIESKLFRYFILFLFTFTLADLVIEVSGNTYITARLIASVFKTLSWTLSLLYWFLYIYQKINKNFYSIRKWLPLIVLPIILLNAYTIFDVIVSIIRGSIIINNIIWIGIALETFLYILLASFLTIKKAFLITHRYERYKFYNWSFIMIIPLVSLPIQSNFFDIPITAPILTLTVLSMYIVNTRQDITIDYATNTNNCTKLENYLEHITQNFSERKRLFYIKIGINKYSKIKKISMKVEIELLDKIGNFLKRQCENQKAFLARKSNDSFALICEKESFSEVESFCNEILRNAETDDLQNVIQSKISFNIYWSEFNTKITSTIDGWINDLKNHCIKPIED